MLSPLREQLAAIVDTAPETGAFPVGDEVTVSFEIQPARPARPTESQT